MSDAGDVPSPPTESAPTYPDAAAHPPGPTFRHPGPASAPRNGTATSGLVIGLISLVTMMLYVGLLLGPIGLLLSIDGLRTARRFKGVTWPAIIGIITSGVTTAILLAVIVVSVR